MKWEGIGIKIMIAEHRVSGDSKSRAVPQGPKSQEWLHQQGPAPPDSSRAGMMTGIGSAGSPAIFRQGEVWSTQEYSQQVRTAEARISQLRRGSQNTG